MRELKEKCGVFAAFQIPEASHRAYLGLFALQHRGQEGAGIVSFDGQRLQAHRGEGLVSQIFSKDVLTGLPGTAAIGHVRYSTAGGSLAKNLQPFLVETFDFDLALAHNGNLTNADKLRRELEAMGSVFQSSSDTEVILHLIAREKGDFESRLQSALSRVEGAYSLVLMLRQGSTNRVFVVKDPHGFRPLVLGKLDGGFVAASESCAFDLVGAELIREVEPGEVVEFTSSGMKSSRLKKKAEPAPCIFEWIYFSRPDSHVFDRSVYEMRKRLGVLLAEKDLQQGLKADLVMGVPDSGIPAAIGYSQRAQLPFELGLIRNHYIGRTFIEPHQSIRDFGVRIKQNPLREPLKGKSIIVVDDSLVRGTTSKKINKILREAGVKEIHMRISAPPTISPCFYGIDTPHESELIAANKSIQQIADFVEADSIRYLEMDSIYQHLKPATSMCDACFTKKYKAPIG